MEIKGREITKEYSNGEITIVWQPAKCIHATHCWKELPEVFNPKKRPWINPNGAPTDRIIKQIDRCPTEALTYYYNNKEEKNMNNKEKLVSDETHVEMVPNGPLMVKGNLLIKDKDGKVELKSGTTAFCRCGGTKNPPYCDGTHIAINFKDNFNNK